MKLILNFNENGMLGKLIDKIIKKYKVINEFVVKYKSNKKMDLAKFL